MRSLKWKLVLIYVALVFIVMIISGTFIIVQVTNMQTDRVKEQLEKQADKIYVEVIEGKMEESFSERLKNMAISSDTQSSILDSKGITIATNVLQGKELPTYSNSAVISAISGAPKFDTGRWSDSTGVIKEWLNYAKPFKSGSLDYIVYLQSDISSIKLNSEKTTQIIIAASFIALVISVVIGFVFADTITRPIITLTKKAKDLARGKFNVSTEVKSSDEIGQLTKNFNYMAVELNNTLMAVSSEKNKLETLLHNMTDGVLAFNKYGKAIHVNAASKQMIKTDGITLTDLETIFRQEVDFEELMLSGRSIKAFANIEKKYIRASFAPYNDVTGATEGIVVVLQDLTDQKTLDDMRKEFVANVSHEIRTPLTTIKSYAETLMDGAIDNRETALDFLNTIDSEVDRMTLLVKDLLQLSRMDSAKYEMNFERVNLCDLIESNVKQCKILADNKNQHIIYNKPKAEYIVNIDKGRATQVVTNIISNAIKYSPTEATIEVIIYDTKNFYQVIIEDNGMGIPEEDLPRIFERFYRVDKARSRAMGGTGLGLAIAKEIMESMNGFIDVKSAVGEGTCMTVYFAKNYGISGGKPVSEEAEPSADV